MSKRARVFLLERPLPRFNVDGLAEHGESVYLAEGHITPFEPQIIEQLVHEGLKIHAFHPKADIVCMTGGAQLMPVFLAAVCARFADIRLLVFDAKLNRFKERQFKARGSNYAQEQFRYGT